MMVLTRRGWLKHEQVRVGDETIGYNFETGRSEWTRITAVHHYPVAPMVRYGNKYWSAECTLDHRCLARVVRHYDGQQTGLTCPECGATSSRRGPGGLYGAPFRSPRALQIHRARTHAIPGTTRGGRTTTREVSAGFALRRLSEMTSQDRIMLAHKADTRGTLDITSREASLLGWIAGDGWLSNEAFAISQSKRQFFNTIDYACGADPRHRRYAERKGRKEHWLPSTAWRLSTAYSRDLLARAGHPRHDAVRMVLAMSTEQRPREVWCPTTELSSWTARSQDGGIFLTGDGDGDAGPSVARAALSPAGGGTAGLLRGAARVGLGPGLRDLWHGRRDLRPCA